MSDTSLSLSYPALPAAVHPPSISLREIWPWALFAFAFLLLLYMVGADQGATSLFSGHLIHEWLHDGRHLLGFPCH
jgi:Probable cobalt transporter subunit (CbtB)